MKLYKYRGNIDRDIQTLINNQIYVPNKDQLNDPTEALVYDEEFFKTLNILIEAIAIPDISKNIENVLNRYRSLKSFIKNNVGIFSLSQNATNKSLWAYYANGHKGFCIEYDLERLQKCFNYNQYCHDAINIKVKYPENPAKLDIEHASKIIRNEEKLLSLLIGTKSKSWQHEDETRLLFNEYGLKPIDFKVVTGIYFGCKMDYMQRNAIMHSLQGRGIKYYQMEFLPNSYNLYSIPIKDDYCNAPTYKGYNLTYDKIYLSEDFMGKYYKYKEQFREFFELTSRDTSLMDIYLGVVDGPINNPIFKIFGHTCNEKAPVKKFEYTLDDLK